MKDQLKYFIKEKTIINWIFILCFLIYLKKLPISSETQPFYIFGISLFFILVNKIKLSSLDIFLGLHIVILSIYFTIQFTLYRTGLVEFFAYLVGPLVYFTFKNRIHLVNLKYAKTFTIMFVALTIIIQLKIPILYEVVKQFYELFIPRADWMDGSNIRGVTLLAPEPSYFSYSAILLITIFDVLDYRIKKKINLYKWAIVLIALFSKSALVFIYVFFYFLFYYLGDNPFAFLKKISTKKILIYVGFFVVAIIPLFFIRTRVSIVFGNFLNYLTTDGGLTKLFLTEVSGSTRFILNGFAFMSLEYAPFGWGIGQFPFNYQAVANNFPEIVNNHWEFMMAYKENRPLKAQTYFANLIADIGVFSIMGFIFVFSTIFKATGNKIKRSLQWVSVLMLIIIQAQISNPIPWILLAIINTDFSVFEKEKIINE